MTFGDYFYLSLAKLHITRHRLMSPQGGDQCSKTCFTMEAIKQLEYYSSPVIRIHSFR